MRQRLCVALLVFCVALAGCGPGVPPLPTIESLDAWRAYSDALDARLGGLQARDSTWQMGDASSTYTIWHDGTGVLTIHENMALGDHGDRKLRYYYSGGLLRYFREEGRILMRGDDGAIGLEPLEREVLLATDGQILGWSNFISGAPVQLDPLVVSGAREHALALLPVDVPPSGE